VVNADLLAVFAGVVNGSLVAELVAYEKGVSMLRGGLISVRGLKLTIEGGSRIAGSLPTLTPRTAQDFLLLCSVVRELRRWQEEAHLKDLLNATVQGRKWLSGGAKDLAEAVMAGDRVEFFC
jgi:hypothetical protein